MKRLAQTAFFTLALATSVSSSHGDAGSHGAAIGKPGDPARASRAVTVDMNDAMRFTPSAIAVRRGETIRFLVKNSGQLKHELVLGTVAQLKEHAALMRRFPAMEHADPNQVAVAPGKTGELVWQFTKAGKVDFACLQPGHFEAGMKGRVTIR